MWRVSFNLLPSETPLQALCRWYFTSTPELERIGDVALHPFEENVVPIPVVQNYTGYAEISLSHLNPYCCSFFIFYTYSKNDITVLGGLTWAKMFELGGSVLLTPDGEKLVQNRAFPLVYEAPFKTPALSPSGSPQWWIPVDLPRTPGYVNQIEGTMDDIILRLLWMLGRRQYVPNREDSVSPLALGIFECTIKDAEKRAAFHLLRMTKEKMCFDEHLQGLGEEDWIRLFEYNGLSEYMKEAMIDKPTNEDLYAFWRRSETKVSQSPPTRIFKVPLEECPPSLRNMPIYSYGLVHLTYKELHPWLWHVFVTQSQKLAVKKWDYYAEEDRWLQPLHDIFDKVSFQEIKTISKYKWENDKLVALDADIEDILSVAPPCVANCMSAQRFPSYDQRLRLLPILQTAGVSKERVVGWFERKNAAFPKSGHTTTKSRFDYDSLWNAKRGPTYCGNIVRDGSPNNLQCPYGGDKRACAPDEREGFRGPHELISMRILKLK